MLGFANIIWIGIWGWGKRAPFPDPKYSEIFGQLPGLRPEKPPLGPAAGAPFGPLRGPPLGAPTALRAVADAPFDQIFPDDVCQESNSLQHDWLTNLLQTHWIRITQIQIAKLQFARQEIL